MSGNSPEKILRTARQFMASRILLSAAELDLFSILARTPLAANDLAEKIGADARALAVLLDALAALDLLVKEGGVYRTAPSASPFLVGGAPSSVLPMVLHAAHLWDRWSRLTAVVRGGAGASSAGTSRGADEMRAFIGAMHVVAEPMAAGIVEAVRPGAPKRLLDVGGASGTYAIAFLQAVPGLLATLFDRPEVVEMARERIGAAGMIDRVDLAAGDFDRDELPGGHDLAFLSAIIHQNSPDQNRDLFGKVFRALDPGGRVVIRDHVMEKDRVHPRDGAVFAVNMLLGTPGGGTYTFEEIRDWLTQTGFSGVSLLKKGEHMDALVEAFKPLR